MWRGVARRTAHEIIPFTALHSHLPLAAASFTYQVKVVVVAALPLANCCVQSIAAVGLVCHARFEKGVESE